MKFYKINADDVFDDDNDGFIFGVEWDVGEFEFHNMWFKSEDKRNKFIKENKE